MRDSDRDYDICIRDVGEQGKGVVVFDNSSCRLHIAGSQSKGKRS